MNFAIWGTGTYYQELKKYINANEIKYLVDNNKQQQGRLLDGKIVCAPNQVDYNQCDYIIILVKHYDKIRQQILALEVPSEKIISYEDLYRVLQIKLSVVSSKKELTLEKWVNQHTGVKIIVVSHDLSRSGVPIALMNLVLLLRKMGYSVLFGSLRETGGLREELADHNIDYISNLRLIYHDAEFLAILKKFDVAVVGTLVLSKFGTFVSHVGIPIVWWLHESDESYYLEYEIPQDIKNICYFAVGNRVKKAFLRFYPGKEIKNLLYYIPDKEKNNIKNNKKMIFAVIGSIGKWKAQDIVVKALEQIPISKRKQMQVLFAGYISDEEKQEWLDIQRQIPQIRLLGEITQKQVDKLYEVIDVLVCPSRFDSMPIVVTQAMQQEIPCIVSDQVGQSEFMEEGRGGFVFPNENANELAKIMTWFTENPQCLKEKGWQARGIYEKYFTEEIMREKIEIILEQMLK